MPSSKQHERHINCNNSSKDVQLYSFHSHCRLLQNHTGHFFCCHMPLICLFWQTLAFCLLSAVLLLVSIEIRHILNMFVMNCIMPALLYIISQISLKWTCGSLERLQYMAQEKQLCCSHLYNIPNYLRLYFRNLRTTSTVASAPWCHVS